jgi:hypothetical protein
MNDLSMRCSRIAVYSMHIYEVRPRKDKRGIDLGLNDGGHWKWPSAKNRSGRDKSSRGDAPRL